MGGLILSRSPDNFRHLVRLFPQVEVSVLFHIVDFPDIDDRRQQISMNFHFNMVWEDPRLELDLEALRNEGVESVDTHSSGLDHLWKPDIYIADLVGFREMKVRIQ